jgi:hypothetical protein
MCRIKELLWVSMTSLLAPVEVGLLGRFRDGGCQRLTFADRRLWF